MIDLETFTKRFRSRQKISIKKVVLSWQKLRYVVAKRCIGGYRSELKLADIGDQDFRDPLIHLSDLRPTFHNLVT